MPGLGQIYNGQARKGFILIFLPLLIFPLYPLCLEVGNIVYPLVIYFLVTIAFYIYVVRDALVTAKKIKNEYVLKKYNRVSIYVCIIIFVGIMNTGLTEYIKNNHIQAFKIPSRSMEPTLLSGDHLLVDRNTSKITYIRGDIVVFEFPEDPTKDYIKRIVGIGGDKLSIKDKVVYINGEPINEPYVVYKNDDPNSFGFKKGRNFGPITVPEGHFFVIGDNRDNSFDSRYFGPIEQSKIKGIVKTIYWSWDKKTKSIRWDRIGLKTE